MHRTQYFGFLALFVAAVAALFGAHVPDLTADLSLCVEWIEGFTAHLDGIALAGVAGAAIPDDPKKIFEAMNREWAEIKEKIETLVKQVPDAEKLGEYDEMFANYDERFNLLEAAAKRARQPAPVKPGELPNEANAHTKDFVRYLKRSTSERSSYAPSDELDHLVQVVPIYKSGKHNKNEVEFEYRIVTPEEAKALSVDVDPAGGFLVSPTMAATVITRVFDTSPVRQYASIDTISSDAYEEVVDDDEAAVGWVGERQARSETATPDFDKLRIPLNELYANPRSTQRMIDMRADIEGWLSRKVADKMSREEATQFVSGDGANKPKGLLSYADDSTSSWNLVKSVISGSAGALTPAGLIDVKADLQVFYLSNASWFMNRTTRSAVRKFRTDAVSAADQAGTFLWEPGLRAGDPDMLLGHPIGIFEDLPDVAANAYPIAFGDMREAYLIIDHTAGVRVLRDPYSSKPYVEFYTTRYVGGALRQGRALRFQKVSA